MKELFPGHFRESEKNLRETWDSCLFVFDANILLNLYRYSDTTKREFLRILEKIKERIWLPHRAADEYLNNRLSVIDQQEKSYDETVKSINSLKSDLDNARQHPFVSQEIMSKVNNVFDSLCDELLVNKGVHTKRIFSDEIKKSISKLFEDSVGEPYDKEKLEQLISEGEERYKQKIPPGFKDGGKAGDSDIFLEKCRKYGDLIVWNQVIDKSIETEKGIIFVTDDKKEDWWKKFKGKTIGPRPELVKEFKDRAKTTFHMYQADRFLELARENLNEHVSEEIVEEIREVRRRDKIAHNQMIEQKYRKKREAEINQLIQEMDHTQLNLMKYDQERTMLNEKLNSLEHKRLEMRNHRDVVMHDDERNIEIDSFNQRYSMINEEYKNVRQNLEHSSMAQNELKNRLVSLEKKISHQMENIEQMHSS